MEPAAAAAANPTAAAAAAAAAAAVAAADTVAAVAAVSAAAGAGGGGAAGPAAAVAVRIGGEARWYKRRSDRRNYRCRGVSLFFFLLRLRVGAPRRGARGVGGLKIVLRGGIGWDLRGLEQAV